VAFGSTVSVAAHEAARKQFLQFSIHTPTFKYFVVLSDFNFYVVVFGQTA
jgi:hypothetical protein